MKIIFKILFVFFISYNISYSQPVMWQRVYNYNENRTHGRDILQTFDGGYIICGTVLNPVRIYLIKLNYLGIREWENIISDSAGAYLQALSIQQTTDSGFVMTGRNRVDLSIVRVDNIGNLLWKKSFNLTNGEAIGRTVRITNDGGFIACGDLFSFTNEKIYVVKTDSIGNLEWEKIYGDSIVNHGYDILQIDHNYYLTGISAPNFAQDINGFVYKLDMYGNSLWKKNFPQFQSTTKIVKLHSNNLILSGRGYPYGIFFSKVDTSGNIFFQKVIPTSNPQFYFRSMCLSSSQKISIAAQERYPELIGFGYYSGAIVDTNGNLIYEKRLISPENLENNPYSIKETSDNGFIFVGDTEYDALRGVKDNILVAKTDSLFNTSSVINIGTSPTSLNKEFHLLQNYPNPFNPVTTISYSIPASGIVKLKVYDITGKEILLLVNELKEAGRYEVRFDGGDLSSGIYFYKLEAGDISQTKRMILIK